VSGVNSNDRTPTVKSPEGQQTSRKASSYRHNRRPKSVDGSTTSVWAKQFGWILCATIRFRTAGRSWLTSQRSNRCSMEADSLDLSLYCSPRSSGRSPTLCVEGHPRKLVEIPSAARAEQDFAENPEIHTTKQRARMRRGSKINNAVREIICRSRSGEAREAAAIAARAAMSLRRGPTTT
jgi:hypothetical protein